jgi:LPXTG-motif cell wall-anchored protein
MGDGNSMILYVIGLVMIVFGGLLIHKKLKNKK